MFNVIDYRTMVDNTGKLYGIETTKDREHYNIYINKVFFASADNMREVQDEIENAIQFFNLK